ncbi:MAG: IS1595 family transposase [Candidatus Binataceae bacterium]
MKKQARKPRTTTTLPALSLDAFDRRFADEEACKQYLFEVRWPDGVVHCPRCDNAKVYKISRRPWTWQCKACNKKGYSFSILTGTIFKDTKMPLKAWFKVAYLILSSKKGISALQVYRMMARTHGADYRTYWFMCHRLRAAMKNEEWPLSGKVEVDETYVGGKNANRPLSKRFDLGGRGAIGKTAVIGAIARKGNVVARVMENTTAAETNAFIHEVVSRRVSLVATDTGAGYKRLDPA